MDHLAAFAHVTLATLLISKSKATYAHFRERNVPMLSVVSKLRPITDYTTIAIERDSENETTGNEPKQQQAGMIARTFLIHNLKLGTLSNPVRNVVIDLTDHPKADVLEIAFADFVPSKEIMKRHMKSIPFVPFVFLPLNTRRHTLAIHKIDISTHRVWFSVDSAPFPNWYPYRLSTKLSGVDKYVHTDRDSRVAPFYAMEGILSHGTVDRSQTKDTTEEAFSIIFMCIRESRPNQVSSIRYIAINPMRNTEKVVPT